MYSLANFEDFNDKAHLEDKKFDDAQITATDYNFPHIYLTDEEIKEFNEECRKAGIDLKVVPLFDYMNSNEDNFKFDAFKKAKYISNSFINKPNNENEKENNNSLDNLDINFNNPDNKKNEEKKYLNKKRKKVINDSEGPKEENKSAGNKNNTDDDKSMSFFSFNNSDINKDKNMKKNDKNKSKNQPNEKKKTGTTVKISKKSQNNIGKNNKEKEKNKKNLNNQFNNWFHRIKETSAENVNEDVEKERVINEIMKISQNLTKDGLEEMANIRHIKLVGDQFKIGDLNKRTSKQLKNILGDININTNLKMLDKDKKKTIKNIRNKEEMTRKKSQERAIKKKKKEEEKKKEILKKNEMQKQKEQEYHEEYSEPSYDENDSLE